MEGLGWPKVENDIYWMLPIRLMVADADGGGRENCC